MPNSIFPKDVRAIHPRRHLRKSKLSCASPAQITRESFPREIEAANKPPFDSEPILPVACTDWEALTLCQRAHVYWRAIRATFHAIKLFLSRNYVRELRKACQQENAS
jgi:hypothetical protein